MPVDFSSHRDGSYVCITGYGDISDVELLRAVQLMYSVDEDTKRHRCALLDFSRVQQADISSETIRTIARMNLAASKLVPPSAAVALVAAEPLVYGLGRMWQAYADETAWTTRIFTNSEEAERWLMEHWAGLRADETRT